MNHCPVCETKVDDKLECPACGAAIAASVAIPVLEMPTDKFMQQTIYEQLKWAYEAGVSDQQSADTAYDADAKRFRYAMVS